MHIAYVSSSVVPSRAANSVHVMKMSSAMASLGHDVRLYVIGSPIETDPFEYYGVAQDFTIERVVRPAIRGIGAVIHAFALRQKLRNAAPVDEIHGRAPYALLLASGYDAPIVYHVHATPDHRAKRTAEAALFRRPNFKRLVAVSNALADEYRRIFPSLEKAEVVTAPNGAEVIASGSESPTAADWPGRSGAPQVGYVGHLYPGRGIDVVLGMAEAMPQADFHVIGGTDSDIAKWRGHATGGSVLFHGFVQPGELWSYYSQIEVALAPYQRAVHMEGGGGNSVRWMSPMKLFDYMIHRVPTVASDLPAIREILTDGQTAVLVEPDDVEQWVQAVSSLIDNPTRRETIAEAAFQLVSTEYTWQKRAERSLIDGGIVNGRGSIETIR